MFGLLCGEPFCWTPAQVGKLTDWQVGEIIIRAAVERNRKRKGDGLPRKKPGKSRLPNREEFINIGVQCFGKTADELGREYDAAMAAHGNQ